MKYVIERLKQAHFTHDIDSDILIVRSNVKENLNQLFQVLFRTFDWSLSLYFYVGSIWQINAVDESNDSYMHVHELFKTDALKR